MESSKAGQSKCGDLTVNNHKLMRCLHWLQTQNSLEPKELAQQNKNDIQFIIQTNAGRKKFLLSAADNDTTVPDGVGECSAKPKKVPLRWLRVDKLRLECAWHSCWWLFNDYEMFQKHVKEHIPNVCVISSSNEDVTRSLTGHCKLNKHMSNLGLTDTALCRYCESAEETPLHLLCYCPAVVHKRSAHLDKHELDPEEIRSIAARKILNFLDSIGVCAEYVCLWDSCHHRTKIFNEMVRHINYHAYHAYLLAIGFNGRATLNLARCTKDSTKRNHLPLLLSEHACMWTGCEENFNAIQAFFDHVKLHVRYSDEFVCSWGGCGATFPRRVLLTMHVRSHTGERLIACYHCGHHFATNVKLANHLRRQNVNPDAAYHCSVCGVSCATEYLVREHARQHVSAYACSLCDMSATSPAALAQHVRYRHLDADHVRIHCCPHCSYRAVTQWDLRKHVPTHKKGKKKRKLKSDSDADLSELDSEDPPKKKKSMKKYACHMCPKDEMKVFSRGSRLTTHLVKVHGAQWPFGHSRFRYQISDDGMYRLTTTRYEILEVSKKIVDGHSGPKELLANSFEFDLKQIAEPTETTPRRFEIFLKGTDTKENKCEIKHENEVKPEILVAKPDKCSKTNNSVEITMCDVDDHGNIISKEIFKSVFTNNCSSKI